MRLGRLAIIILFVCAPAAQAQYKWIDSGGQVGYGDKPPPDAQFVDTMDGFAKGEKRDPQAQLPYQLQRTMKDYPVTLYTMSDCAPCDAGRSLLKGRAVPFAERTVRTVDDVQALKKLTGSDKMPAFQVGQRIMTGFNSATWNETLDLAGYPRKSVLPADYTWPAPKPLTEADPAQPTAPQAVTAPSTDHPR